MGNQQSVSGQTLSSKDVDFKSYVQSHWRSQRSNELDSLGGLGRPALALGQSFNAKMQYLGEQLLEQGDKMQEILAPSAPTTFTKEPANSRKHASGVGAGPKNTYIRAVERRGERAPDFDGSAQTGAQQPASRFLSQAEYQKMRKAAKAAEKQKQAKAQRPPAQPAEWRVRVHQSRRNVLLTVKTMLLLKRGHKHPKRMMRFSDLSFYIPQLLAEDCSRFVNEQQNYSKIRQDIAGARAELDDLLRSSAHSVPTIKSSENGAIAELAAGAKPLPLPGDGAAAANTGGVSVGGGADVDRLSGGTGRVSDSNAAVAAGGALVMCYSDQMDRTSTGAELGGQRASPGDGQRRVTFDGDQSSRPEGLVRHVSPGDSRPSGPVLVPIASTAGTQGRSRSVDREGRDRSRGAAAGSDDESLQQQTSIGITRRPLPHDRLSDVIEDGPGEGAVVSPGKRIGAGGLGQGSGGGGASGGGAVKLPNVFGSPKRQQQVVDKLSGGGSSNAVVGSPVRRPWGASVTKQMSMQQRMTSGRVGRDGSDQRGDTVEFEDRRSDNRVSPGQRVNRQLSMPVASRFQGNGDSHHNGMVGALVLPDINGNRDSAGGGGAGGRMVERVSSPTMRVVPRESGSNQEQVVVEDGASLVVIEPVKTVNRYGRMAQIRVELDKQYDLLKRSSKLMGMYINRVNGAWAESQQWTAPVVTSLTDLQQWCKGDQFNVYKADVMRQLRLGQIAVQIFCGDDHFTLPARGKGSGGGKGQEGPRASTQEDLWTADLWEIIEAARPGIMPATARIGGLTLCGRALCQLVLSAQSLAGPDALERLHVILHVNEDQEEEVMEELHIHQCYGLVRSNVLVVVGQRHPGYRWDVSDAQFTAESALAASWSAGASLAATASGHHPGLCGLGSGSSLCQLAWAGEAFSVGEDGTPVPLQVPVLERLESKKIDWIVTRRARDLGLLKKDGVLDIAQLAHAMHQRDKMRTSCVLEVTHADSAVTARLYDSVVLHPAAKGSGEASRLVTELRQAELVAGPVISLVEGLRTTSNGKGLALGMSRYLLHVPSLKSQMTSLSNFRPRLSLSRHLLHVGLDIADLFVHEKGRALAVEGSVVPGVLATHNSLEALLPLLQAQDHDPAFRDLVLKMVPQEMAGIVNHAELPTVVAGNRNAQKPGHPIIVFVANNQIANATINCAANIARAGRDTIQLVNIVPSDMQKTAAEEMLANYKRIALRSMAEVTTHVVIRRTSGLLECMERFVAEMSAQESARPLVVMGSIQLTSSVFSYMASSVTLSAVKRLAGTPVVVVTLNSKQIPTRAGMRVMALVEPHAKNMVSYLCKHMIDHGRGDRLVLSQVQPSPHVTRQQAAATRRLLDNFHTLAFSHQTPIHKAVAGEGPMESVLCEQVEEHGVGMVALQLPPGTKSIPTHLLNMMRSCRGATLIYQDNGMRQSVMRKSMTLQKSIGLLSTLQQARRALALGEALTAGHL